jgi:hypothetical protein
MTIPTPGLMIAFVLDRTGSMEPIKDATIEAFNGFLASQKAEAAPTLMTLVQFDSEGIDTLTDCADIADVRPLNERTYLPRASTPLYDAVGRTLVRTEERLAKLGWPGRVLFVIQTDGLENASREWTRDRVFAKIRELRDRGWAFLFLGVNEDAYVQGEQLGFAPGSVASHGHSRAGIHEAVSTAAAAANDYRYNRRQADSLILDEERKRMERTRTDRSRH